MKKLLALILAMIMLVSFAGCGENDEVSEEEQTGVSEQENEVPEEDEKTYQLNDMIGTDILKITLISAEPAIALENTMGNTFYLPKEYNSEEDYNNPHVAAIGHNLITMTYLIENLDRTSHEVDGYFNPTFIAIEYDGQIYEGETSYGCESLDGKEWYYDSVSNVLLNGGENVYKRCYVDIPAEVEGEFSVIFYVPSSSGEIQEFKYVINNG